MHLILRSLASSVQHVVAVLTQATVMLVKTATSKHLSQLPVLLGASGRVGRQLAPWPRGTVNRRTESIAARGSALRICWFAISLRLIDRLTL